MVISLIGNPNCGKSTLFNRLTGLNQHVGSFPGVTVEKKEGKAGDDIIVDLPGTYSLTPYSLEEKAAVDFKCDVYINVADASSLGRGLFLTLELIERGGRLVLALNMADELIKNGGGVDVQGLSSSLGIPVILVSAKNGENVRELTSLAREAEYIKREETGIEEKYKLIETLCEKYIVQPQYAEPKLDRLLLSRYFAFPCFIVIMASVFILNFGFIGPAFGRWITYFNAEASRLLGGAFAKYGLSPVLRSLALDGALPSVGGVLAFLPSVASMYFFLAILEDSGYMARVAFVSDALMGKISLSGKSLVPLILGFGCSVPAILATRTLPDERDRKMTALLVPFMSCGAKLPVYSLVAASVLPGHEAPVIASAYVFGVTAAVIYALILKKTFLRGDGEPLLLELPAYRRVSLRNVASRVFERTLHFFTRAFTVVFTSGLLLWFLSEFDYRFTQVESDRSLLSSLGHFLAPVFRPLGFGDWRSVSAVLAGFAAKEASAGALSVLKASFTLPSGAAFIVFTLLAAPCAAAVKALSNEIGARRTALYLTLQTVFAWLAAFCVYTVMNI